MDKPWLDSYPSAVPADIDIHEYSSVVDIFTEATERFGDRPAFQNLGKTITYQELDRLTDDELALVISRALQ